MIINASEGLCSMRRSWSLSKCCSLSSSGLPDWGTYELIRLIFLGAVSTTNVASLLPTDFAEDTALLMSTLIIYPTPAYSRVFTFPNRMN
eukprot:391841-Alexandrium_andersonii.AAC.1